MKPLPLLAGSIGLFGAGALAHHFAARKARHLQSLPSPIPYEVLSEEPKGTQLFVDRPDGTRLRVCVEGKGPTVVLAHGYGVTLGEWNVIPGARNVWVPGQGHLLNWEAPQSVVEAVVSLL